MAKRKRKRKTVSVRALKRAHREELERLHGVIRTMQHNINRLMATLRWHERMARRERTALVSGRQPVDRREQEMNWAVYDRIAASITDNERALFEASPAYQKYMQWRKTGGMVKSGDWRAP